jgi:hypothetical protein
MRETMREYMEAQMKAIIAEVSKTHIHSPNCVDIHTQTTVSTTTQPNISTPTPNADEDQIMDTDLEIQQNAMVIEHPDTTSVHKSAKRTMTTTPNVFPVKGFGSIVPHCKLPVPPSRKLSYSL